MKLSIALRRLLSLCAQCLMCCTVSGLYYSTPQRLDVYRNGAIIYPTNAAIVNGKYTLRPKDQSLPDNQVPHDLRLISCFL